MWLSVLILDAASFDCTKARNRVDKMICADAEISSLDSKLGKIYSSVSKKLSVAKRDALWKDELIWMKKRNRCRDGACLVDQYTARISYLQTFSTARFDNNIILLNGEEDGDVADMLIRGNGEQCRVSIDSMGTLVWTNCLQLTNSKRVKILCTKKKKICKTVNEMRNALNSTHSSQGPRGTYEVTTVELNIRDNPSKESNILGTVRGGDRVDVYEFYGKWARTKYGWISGKYLKPIQNDRYESAAIQTESETGHKSQAPSLKQVDTNQYRSKEINDKNELQDRDNIVENKTMSDPIAKVSKEVTPSLSTEEFDEDDFVMPDTE